MMGAPAEEEGSKDLERPVHRVDFAAPFAIGVHEVTVAQWAACVAAGGCDGYEPSTDDYYWAFADRDRRPVFDVNWHDAQGYVAWLSAHTGETYRLPSEAEWEYAARAGTRTPFHFGETISTDQANYDGSTAYGDGSVGEARLAPLPVGSFPANAWGLHDVHGNVVEWTQDCGNYSDYTGALGDGSAWETSDCADRVMRGGDWISSADRARSAARSIQPADFRNVQGIRVVRELGDVASTTTLPLVLSAREAPRRWSLVRIVNRSAAGGTVSIRAVDDSGDVRGPVALTLNAGHAAHFDSHDLETGNPGKGLPEGVGPGNGDWRLLLGTALDVESLAYVYTQDGFLASMHDVVPATGLRHRVPAFNPAGNRQQASRLRLINANAEAAEVIISAVDDFGAAAPGGTVALTIPSGEARTVSAEQLEAGGETLRGSLGDGVGKWRLSVAASRPVVVMSLQTSPDGGMTNISTRPPPATEHALPLLLAGHRHPAQGFVRVVNTSDTAGEVAIHATSDAGRRYGPLALSLGARRAAHFNSADLEQGNLDKGLSGGGTGSGEGDWRLHISSQLPIEVLAYAHGPAGHLVMHDVAPSVGRTHRVPIFNPASERDQVSELRLVNPGAQDADISIAATDDLGQPAPAGGVSLTLGAQESRTVTAQQLEEGASNLAGSLGDGDGRWRLTISASAPAQVMNLLRGADGRLSNLSTSPTPPSE